MQNVVRRFDRSLQVPFRVHFENFPSTKGKWQGETCVQSQASESVFESKTLSTYKSSENSRFHTGKRFSHENRPQKRLFPHSNSGKASSVSRLDIQRTNFQYDLLTLRARDGSPYIFKDNKLDSGLPEITRYPNGSLPRRLFTGVPKSRCVKTACQTDHTFVTKTGLCNKHGQDFCNSCEGGRVLGYSMELRKKHKKDANRKSQRNPRADLQSCSGTYVELAGSKKSDRTTIFCIVRGSPGTASLPQVTNGMQQNTTVLCEEISYPNRGSAGSRMVVRECQSIFKHLDHGQPNQLPNDRCFRLGLGSDAQRLSYIAAVDRGSVELALQPERDVGGAENNQRLRSDLDKSYSLNPDGQSNSSSLYKEGRRDQIEDIVGNGQGATKILSQTRNCSGASICSRSFQCGGRSSIQRTSPSGLVTFTDGEKDVVPEVGRPKHRSLRNEAIGSSPSLCVHRSDGPTSLLHQCVQSELAVPVSMGLSSTNTGSQSTEPLELGCGDIYLDRTSMGQSLLACGHQIKSCRCAISNTKSSTSPVGPCNGPSSSRSKQFEFGGLEDSGWATQLSEWRKEDIELLRSSWRSSTLKSYKAAWCRWKKWAQENELNANNPSPDILARFLCYLSSCCKLAPNTIALHKSVVTTFANPGSSETIGSSPIVRRVMKAIQLKRPLSRQPIWDISAIIEWIFSNPPKEDSIFEVSRYVALILVLASGRRIHDLTLLHITDGHMEKRDDSIIFWPIFGSKTDSISHKQSGWQIKGNGNGFDPVSWIEKLILISNPRREAIENLSTLFISTRGRVKAASRSIIAGWIRTAFKEVGIHASPGSIRSAVSSNSWENNLPLEDLLARGNWKRKDTFFKYYFKEIQRSKSSNVGKNMLRDSFCPV